MASTTTQLIEEVRSFTGYADHEISDSKFSDIIGVAKEEIRSDLGDPSFTFFGEETHNADRALFWFTCIGAKAHTGEIGSIDLTLEDLQTTDSNDEYNFWLDNLQKALRRAADSQVRGASSALIERDDRTYEFDTP